MAPVVQTRAPEPSVISLEVPMMSLPAIWRRDVTVSVASLRQIGGNDIIGTTSEITDADGVPVCSTSATLVHRGADA